MRRAFIAVAVALTACQCPGPVADNTPPSVTILSPADGATVRAGQPVTLAGEGTDAEDGVLGGDRLAWSSDLQGPLGQGTSLPVSFTAGRHRVTLQATDSKGLTATAQLTLIVQGTSGNTAPTVAIDAPADQAVFDQGQSIPLVGHAHDAEDGKLTGLSLSWTSDRAGQLGSGEQVTFSNAALGTHLILLTAVDSVGAAASAAIRVVVVPPGTNRPPAVTIASPSNGASLTLGASVSLEGSALDPEDGPLPATALTWTSSRDGALGQGSPLLNSTLTAGLHVLTLSAGDSKGATGSAQVSVTVNPPNNQPPLATITAPAHGFAVPAGTALTLSGSAQDPEDGALTGPSLAWSSSVDGPLGTGSSLQVSTLSVGVHTLRLLATDSQGAQGVATVQGTVLPPNQPPVVSISSPSNGQSFTAGTSVLLAGSATDPEDGVLQGSALTWRSSLDGVLGTGGSLSTPSLSVGQHLLTLTAADSQGRTGSAQVTITITSGTRLPPVARLTGPTQANTGAALTFDGSTSSDPDGTVVSYEFDFGDGTPGQSGAASSAPHTYAAAGVFTVQLTVRDNDGLTGTTSLVVSVSSAPRIPVVAVDLPHDLGGSCQIEAQGSVLHVVFREEDHAGLYYTRYVSSWTTEFVDGMGFTNGGQVDALLSLKVDANGAPHVGYGYVEGQARYATKSAGGWTRERIDSATFGIARNAVSLALDAQGRAMVAFDGTGSGYARVTLAQRTGPGTWSPTRLSFGTGASEYMRGELLVDAAGVVYLPLGGTLGQWSGTAGSAKALPSYSSWTPATFLGSSQRLALLTPSGALDVAVKTPFSSSTVSVSLVESFSTSLHAVAQDSVGQVRLAVNHGSQLEVVEPDASGFWRRTDLGPTDNTPIDAAVDAAGNTRVCFFRAGNLLVY